jgi:conjugal transfer pilus assembly protein TraF
MAIDMSVLRLSALAFVCAVFSTALPSHARAAPAGDPKFGYFERSDQGWFWYHDPKLLPPSPPSVAAPSPVASNPDEPQPLSAKWFREKLDGYRDSAIDNPSPENVRLYLYLQRLALDKAEMYSHATQLAVAQDPALDQASLTPTNQQSKAAANGARSGAVKSLMNRLSSSSGIWFFFRSDCQYCHAQAPVLRAMATLYGFKILPISMDQKPMEDGSFPDWVPDSGQGKAMHVSVTPTLFFVMPPDKVIPLGVGVMAADQLEDRIVELGRQVGIVTDREYAAVNVYDTKSYMQNGLPSDLSGIDQDPNTLLALLQASAQRGGETPLGNVAQGDVSWKPAALPGTNYAIPTSE